MSSPRYNQGFAGSLILFLFMTCLVSCVCFPVSAVAPTVASITPSIGINTTTVSITDITGTGISAPASVKLTRGIFNLSHKGSLANGGVVALNQPYSVYVSGNFAYLASVNSNALEIVDVSNPSAPVHRGSIINGTSAHLDFPMNVYVSGNRACVASGTSKGLEVVDVSDPANPRQEAFLLNGVGGALLNFPYDVQVAGNYAYVAARDSNALEIVDLADTTWYPKTYGTGVNVASATHITAATLDLTNFPAGLYNVIVSNYNGEQGVLTNGFTITGLPAVTGISPTSGSTSGAHQLSSPGQVLPAQPQ